MPSTFALAPIPFWLEREANGKPAANCIMYPRSSLDHQVVKNVFMDPAGMIPWPLDANGGIVFRDNGTQGPFYWENTGLPNDLYYLEFWTADGQLFDTIDTYPIAGNGGGTPITVISNLSNFIIDGQFSYNELGTLNLTPIPAGTTFIQLVDFSYPAPNRLSPGGWIFEKNVVGNNDSLSIVQPSLSSTSPPSNPRGILTYSATVAGAGTRLDATYITLDSKSFQNETIQFQFQAMASGSAPIGVSSEVIVRQFFGTGGAPSAPVETTFSFVWPTVFAPITKSITVPSTAGKARGSNNDDYFEIGVRFPIGSTGIYQITNVMGVRGTVVPPNYIYDTQAETYYKIASSLDAFIPTGMIMQKWSPQALNGWVLLQDTATFGTLASAALHKGQTFFNLFTFLWNNLPNTVAPVSSGRGVSALADWNANKNIRVPLSTDCVFANASGSGTHTIGQKDGAFTKIISASNLPPLSVTVPFALGAGSAICCADPGPLVYANTIYPVNPGGSSIPFNVTQPTNWIYTFIKL
jgi:hypothetical protein